MKLKYTKEALSSLRDAIIFNSENIPVEKLLQIRNRLLDRADELIQNPWIGQKEEYLESIALGHRRIVEGNFKIVYRIEGDVIYITDIFDTKQDPRKMKS